MPGRRASVRRPRPGAHDDAGDPVWAEGGATKALGLQDGGRGAQSGRTACRGHQGGKPVRLSARGADEHTAASRNQTTQWNKPVAFGEGEEGMIDLWKCASRRDKGRTRRPPAACLCRIGGRSARAVATVAVACRRLASACSPIPRRLPEARYAFLTSVSDMSHRRAGEGAPLEV